MAQNKASKKMAFGAWRVSMRELLIAGSVVLNIAFVVVGIAMVTTHSMDGMFIKEGLTRYCAVANDSKFEDSTPEVIALRDFTCARGDAAQYFEEGVTKYMSDYRIPHTTTQNDQ